MIHHHIQANPELSSYDYFSEQAGWTPNNTILRLWEAYRDINSYTEDMAIPILSKGTDTLYNFEGSAIMRKDRIVGEISPEETLVYNIFHKKYTGGTNEISDHSSVLVKKATIRRSVSWDGSIPRMNTHINLKVVVSENRYHVSEAEIDQNLEKMVEEKATALIRKLQWFPQMEHEFAADVQILNSIYFKAPDKVKRPETSRY